MKREQYGSQAIAVRFRLCTFHVSRFADQEQELSTELAALVRERIADAGQITFRDYMELALYQPSYGYYTAGRVRLGREGDFVTSPEADPAFGALLGRFVARVDAALGQPDPFTLTEFGAGSGRLMAGVLDELRGNAAELYRRLVVRIVEASPALRERQRQTLAEAGHGDLATWADGAGGVGLVMSNELVDAFAVHRVVMRDGELRELYVTLDGDQLVDSEGPLSTPELAAYFERLGIWPVEGQRTEVNLAALRWLDDVAADLQRGYVLTIDYGDSAERLHSALRPEGTLLAYTGGRVTADPYAAPGDTDITAHVDFTALQRRGEEIGLRTVWLKRQMEFLVEQGIGEMFTDLMSSSAAITAVSYQETIARRDSLFRLIDPDGLGRFHVLLQWKELEGESAAL